MSQDRIRIVQGDITKQQVDAIVNAANRTLMGGGGVDGAIHRAAGEGLVHECVAKHPRGCPAGEARLTGGHELPTRYVIHTVGPVYRGGDNGEAELLESCYRNALALAAENGVETIAFPAISCGVYGYPHEEAAQISLTAAVAGLEEHDGIVEIRFVLFQKKVLDVFRTAIAKLPSIPQMPVPEPTEEPDKPKKKHVDRRRPPSKPIEW